MAPRDPPYRAGYSTRQKRLVDQANANPATVCMEHCTCAALTLTACHCGQACGRTLAQHPPTSTGNPPTWSAGHTDPTNPRSPLRPSVLSCNVRERNDRINARAEPHTEVW